jgi:hypothetical protein
LHLARAYGCSLTHYRADDVTVREPSSWAGLFGALGGWSGGLGSDAELYG